MATLEQVISDAVSNTLAKQLQPLLQPIMEKLKLDMATSGNGEEYLTTPEAAKLLKVSPITMSIWRHEKRGPEYIVIGGGRGVRYKRSVLTEFLENNKGLIGKKGRPSSATPPDARTIATSGVTTMAQRVRGTKRNIGDPEFDFINGGKAQAGK